MTRQVLDLGDQVKILRHGLTELVGQEGVIVGDEGRYSVWLPEVDDHNIALTHGWVAHHLERLGGELQLGDFVTVKGRCPAVEYYDHISLDGERGVIVDDFEDGMLMVHCMGEVVAVKARPDQLTRITRAEGQA
ncbi:hypothetical protein [uncultured Deinococcus sp.]|uniref:hypothetical protein n=1 Tax=uncultured Deinococcus sp. TaxID=158789 RepID=UPI0025CED7CA|nr:hypothetical protein [uncultured Deinococcus sp.]